MPGLSASGDHSHLRFEGRCTIGVDQLSADDRSRFRALKGIFEMPREEAIRLFSPYFVTYHSRLFRERGYLRCILDFVTWWSALLSVAGREMLDIGCGFGVYTLLFTFCGAKRVYGADHNREKFDLFSRILALLNPPVENVTLSLQDGHRLSFDDGRFPAIFVKDVISHVREPDLFFGEVSRLLSPGGRVLITDENNALEVFGRSERRRKWNAWEYRGVKREDLRADDPSITYRAMRREDIEMSLAGVDISSMPGVRRIVSASRRKGSAGRAERDVDREKVLDALARMTQGLWGEAVIEGAREILQTGRLQRRPDFLYRQPRTGDCLEREFNPFSVARMLRRHGLDSRVVRPFYYTQKPLLNIIGTVIRATHPLSIFLQPNFYVLATKRSR